MGDVDKLLKERGKTHGDYADHARCTRHLMDAMRQYKNWPALSDCQLETLHMIAHKIGRILTGNPDVEDHWVDIAGYAQLIVNDIQRRSVMSSKPIPVYTFGTPEDGGHHARQGCPHIECVYYPDQTKQCLTCGMILGREE